MARWPRNACDAIGNTAVNKTFTVAQLPGKMHVTFRMKCGGTDRVQVGAACRGGPEAHTAMQNLR